MRNQIDTKHMPWLPSVAPAFAPMCNLNLNILSHSQFLHSSCCRPR